MSSVLVTVASRGDLLMLDRALGGEFECYSEEDLSEALLRTACHGYIDCLSKLLKHGADPDCVDLDGDTPLMLAASNNHVGVARILIKNGCDVNVRSDRNRTALHMAVWNQRPRIVRLLLDARCDLNPRDQYGDTPLMLSARRGYSDIMKVLLVAGCDANKYSNEKETALHYACRHGHIECVRLLIPRCSDLDAPTIWGLTPLMHAMTGGATDSAIELLSAGANVTTHDKANKTVLHHAVRHNNVVIADWLLELGADPNTADADGNVPVFEAIVAGRPQMVQLLTKFGCRVRDVIGRATINGEYRWSNPLEAAIHLGQLRSAKILHAAGCEFSQFVVSLADEEQLDEAVRQWLSAVRFEPRSLADMTRIAIRHALDGRVTHKLNTLRLPAVINNFLCFADESEFSN